MFVEEHSGPDFSPGEIVVINCPNVHCKEKPWFYCKSCKCRNYLSGLKKHASRKRHQEQHAILYPPQVPIPPPPPMQSTHTLTQDFPSFPDDYDPFVSNDDINDASMMDGIELYEALEKDLASTHVEFGDSPMDVSAPAANIKQTTAEGHSHFPKINNEGNEWLAEAFKDVNLATVQELFSVFSAPELRPMKNFWVAELGSGEGRCGGGAMYLAGRAFQQVKDGQLDRCRFPDFEEAKWQLINLIQYQSMNEKQRHRQSRINKTLMQYFPPEMFFKQTLLPPYNQLGRYYGSSGQHSMWNNLPCPAAKDIDGVAYVSVRAIVAFAMANAIPIDDVLVTADSPDTTGPDHLRRVHNVDECQKSVDWYRKIQSTYYGSKNGAPNSNSNSGAPKHPAIVCINLSDWADGFEAAKVKSNRNAIDSKTFTISPPKCQVNGTDNTFPLAVGLKRAKGWRKIAQMFREEVEELTCSPEPILFYHGGIQKLVPCVFKRFAVLSDKMERNGLTGTIGCGSDIHRCFGVSGKVQTPPCKVKQVETFLRKQASGTTKAKFGWSNKFIDSANGQNGAVFPSCPTCRIAGLNRLIGGVGVEDPITCNQCQNWDLLGPEGDINMTLQFPAHNDWPTWITQGCPVAPPKGRDIFGEGVTLPFVRITWKMMINASKFAFYQASRPKKFWTKGITTCFLKYCGLSQHLADLVHTTARACCKAKLQDNIDYSLTDSIGKFQFHPNWLSQDVSVEDFIEAIMHQLFLGAAESNFELIGLWLSESPAAAKVPHSRFLNTLQELLQDLRGYGLQWLNAYPLTGKKGKLGTGSWVAENWVCYVRISQFIYGWCCRDHGNASKYGVDDVSRLVISYHAFVARCLTHSGIDAKSIAETELFMKEFLSSLREVDVRVRYKSLNKKTTKASELKGTEAWWLKANYMSLRNLLFILRVLGPLVLWWDGGGKGERFIQLVKPHIKNGVRNDEKSFFVNLLEKLFWIRQLEILEKRFGLAAEEGIDLNKEEKAVLDLINEIADSLLSDEEEEADGSDSEDENEDDNTDDEDTTTEFAEDEDYESPETRFDEAYFSTNEVHGMTKTKTIYVYRNENQLKDCISNKRPLAGIVEVNNNLETGEAVFQFNAVYRKPVKQFARVKVKFDDSQGLFSMECGAPKLKFKKRVSN